MEIVEEQQRFRKGSGMMDGMFMLRELVEKRLKVQGELALGFVDPEKVYENVPIQMVMTTLRWMRVPEAEVKLVEGMCKGIKGRVLVGPGMSEEFGMNIGLRQVSALSPLMFIMVMELESRKVSLRGGMGRMLYVDDLAVVIESGRDMQEVPGEWKEAFGKHRLKMSMDKTEVIWVVQQKTEMKSCSRGRRSGREIGLSIWEEQ